MDIILKYFPELSSDKIEKFKQLEALYIYWNQRINVVSRKNINELYINHVLHSLAIAKIINFKPLKHLINMVYQTWAKKRYEKLKYKCNS